MHNPSQRRLRPSNARQSSSGGGQSHARGRLGLLLLLAVGMVVGCHQAPDPPPDSPADATKETNQAATASAVNADFLKLKGRWVRPDGGYVIEVRHVQADGTVVAGYYNPNPIRVARAEARSEDGATKLFIELRDTGYPGSTYTLTYQSQRDELEGVYFQAGMGQYYDVFFQRMK